MPRQKTAPPRAIPTSDDGYFETLTRAVFQAGFSWDVIEAKWPGFLEAFNGFRVDEVADFGPTELERLLGNPGIVRNKRKIEATVENARTIQRLRSEHGSVIEWLRTMEALPWPERKKKLVKPFKNFGPSSAYYFLWCVGEPVPPYHDQQGWSDPVPAGSPDGLVRP